MQLRNWMRVFAACLVVGILCGCTLAQPDGLPATGCSRVSGPLGPEAAREAVDRFVRALQQGDAQCVAELSSVDADIPAELKDSLARTQKTWDQASVRDRAVPDDGSWLVIVNSGAATYQFSVVGQEDVVVVRSLSGMTGTIGG